MGSPCLISSLFCRLILYLSVSSLDYLTFSCTLFFAPCFLLACEISLTAVVVADNCIIEYILPVMVLDHLSLRSPDRPGIPSRDFDGRSTSDFGSSQHFIPLSFSSLSSSSLRLLHGGFVFDPSPLPSFSFPCPPLSRLSSSLVYISFSALFCFFLTPVLALFAFSFFFLLLFLLFFFFLVFLLRLVIPHLISCAGIFFVVLEGRTNRELSMLISTVGLSPVAFLWCFLCFLFVFLIFSCFYFGQYFALFWFYSLGSFACIFFTILISSLFSTPVAQLSV